MWKRIKWYIKTNTNNNSSYCRIGTWKNMCRCTWKNKFWTHAYRIGTNTVVKKNEKSFLPYHETKLVPKPYFYQI